MTSKSTKKVKYEILKPKDNFRPFDEDAEKEEERLTELLFGNNKTFVKYLAEEQNEQGTTQEETEINTKGRKPKWKDVEEESLTVKKALKVQKRKLPGGGINEPSNKYLEHVEHKFKNLVGTPKWASLDRPKTDGNESDEELYRTCGFLEKKVTSSLPPSQVEFKKLKDLNAETQTEGKYINSVQFHPTSSVALVAGQSGVASFIAVDGKNNSKLQSVKFQNYPIAWAEFRKGGNEAVFGSKMPYCYEYDLLSSKSIKVPLPNGITQCKSFRMSPCGSYMAVCGKWGQVHLLSAHTKESVVMLKQNNEITDLCFDENGMIYGHSDSGEVTIWDLRSKKLLHRFTDEGCLQGTSIRISPCGKYIATGSGEGVVNLYDSEDVFKLAEPKPRKRILNLRTSIKDLSFNCTSEMLVFASMDMESSVRLFHSGNQSVFKNFPNLQCKLGHIVSLNFSPNGGYLALGNNKSVVHLYRLKHYKNY